MISILSVLNRTNITQLESNSTFRRVAIQIDANLVVNSRLQMGRI